MYVIKPVYFQKDSITLCRLLFVVNVNTSLTGDVDRSSFVIPQRHSSLIKDIETYFIPLGIESQYWKITPPVHLHYTYFDEYLKSSYVVNHLKEI